MSDDEIAVFTVSDDGTLLGAVREVIRGTFGIELHEVEGDQNAVAVDTDLGTLIVGVLSDFIVSLELGLGEHVGESAALLEYLNARNVATTFVTFSVLDERVWVSGNVDGQPFAPSHLVRVLDFMFQAASALNADLEVTGDLDPGDE